MIVIHAAFWNRQWVLWGEKKVDSSNLQSSKKRGRPAKNPPPKEHPFALSHEELEQALNRGKMGSEERFRAWLPSCKGLPIPSSAVLAACPEGDLDLGLSPWTVCGGVLEGEALLEFISSCRDRESLEKGVFLGIEFPFLTEVYDFALALIVRQRYLPQLQKKSGSYEACWEPVLLGKDRARFQHLCEGFPPVSRCFSPTMKHQDPPDEGPEGILLDCVQEIMRVLIQTKEVGSTKPSSIHDEWIQRMQVSPPTFTANPTECQRLYAQLQEWKRPLKIALQSPFRFCVRLEEPSVPGEGVEEVATPGDSWYVRYLLQSHEDPSLLVGGQDVWNPKGENRKILEKKGFNARQYLLATLGIVAGMIPEIEASLSSAIPEGYELDVREAFTFLNEKAAFLEDAGYGVILPRWWSGKGTKKLKVSGKVSPKMGNASQGTLWDMVQVDWKMVMGDKEISLEELEAITRLKQPLVHIGGEWVHLNHTEIQRAIAFWKKQQDKEVTVQEAIQVALGNHQELAGIALDHIQAEGWIKDLLDQLQGNVSLEELRQPQAFRGTLRHYQRRGFSWLVFLRQWGLGACFADDMGLGKTPQTLASILYDYEVNGVNRPTLLICPTTVIENWCREAEKFSPSLTVLVHYGINRLKGEDFQKEAEKYALVITSYALLTRDRAFLSDFKWAGVILDEAQAIKNAHTKQSKAACKIPADYRVALTGTPVENHVGDLWSLMHFLNPGFLGTEKTFKTHFFQPIQRLKCQEKTQQLKAMTAPFILRREKTDKTIVPDLPDKVESTVYCSLTKEQASLYQAAIDDATTSITQIEEEIERKGIVLATLMKLKQICNHPCQFLRDGFADPKRSGKFKRFMEMVDEVMEVGDRALIFTQFAEMGHILKDQLEETYGKEVLFLHGGVSKKRRDRMVKRFQDPSSQGPHLFVLSLRAGGVGLNLTQANHVFHYDRWWNPSVENQATDRAFRIGQIKNVQVHKFVCAGTLEERIAEMIEEKQKVAKSVVGTGEGWLTELSTDELCQMWKLRAEVMVE